MRKFYLAIIILFLNSKIVYGQNFKVALDANVGQYNFSIIEGNSYWQKAENKSFSEVQAGLKLSYAFSAIKISTRLSYLSQSMSWDSINVYPLSDDRVWSSLKLDFNRLQLYVGLGYEIPIKAFYLEPEFLVFFSFPTKFEGTEVIHNPPFYNYEAAEYTLNHNEFGARISVELGYYLTDRISLGLRPAYYYSELEIDIVDNPLGNPATTIKGLAIGVDLGYTF